LIFIFTVFSATAIIAQEEEGEEIPPGMEIIHVGAARVLVPQGTRTLRRGSLLTLESRSEYVARRFLGIEAQIQEIAAKEEGLEKEVERLKEVLSKMQETDVVAEEKPSE